MSTEPSPRRKTVRRVQIAVEAVLVVFLVICLFPMVTGMYEVRVVEPVEVSLDDDGDLNFTGTYGIRSNLTMDMTDVSVDIFVKHGDSKVTVIHRDGLTLRALSETRLVLNDTISSADVISVILDILEEKSASIPVAFDITGRYLGGLSTFGTEIQSELPIAEKGEVIDYEVDAGYDYTRMEFKHLHHGLVPEWKGTVKIRTESYVLTVTAETGKGSVAMNAATTDSDGESIGFSAGMAGLVLEASTGDCTAEADGRTWPVSESTVSNLSLIFTIIRGMSDE